MRDAFGWFSGGRTNRIKPRSRLGYSSRQQPEFCVESLEARVLLTAVVTPTYTVTNDWGSGFQAQLRLDNQQTSAINAWRLEFDLAANITSIWDAKIISHVGTHYVVSGAAWNNTLGAGGAAQFGFVASPGGSPAAPTNLKLNGNPLDGAPAPVGISIDDVTVNEGQGGTTNAVLTVSLSAPAAAPVSVRYATTEGTAQRASDYRSASGTLTFAVSETTKTISVTVVGETTVESDESVFVDLSAPVGAVLSKARGTLTIKNDDVAPSPAGNVQFQVTSDWGSGFTGQVTARNGTSSAINDWHLEFDFSGAITAIWDAAIVSHVGNHYVVQNAGYNSVIAAGATAAFGFNGSPGNVAAGPTNYVLRSGETGSVPDTNHPPTVVPAPSTWPAHVFAPYVDMTLYPTYDLVAAAQNQQLRYFTLAFVVADGRGLPAWGGYTDYELGSPFDARLRTQIGGLRALGGDVIASFGGAANQELAQVITDPVALVRAYQSVIDAYGLTHIDFDIEGAAVADRASIDRRNQAIATLQGVAATAGKTLAVSFTLPVLPTGLTGDGVYVLQSALRWGVNLGVVNVMAMDYGDSAAPNPQGRMGDYAIAAANSLFSQLKSLFGAARSDAQLWQMVGVTPMIGLNDVTTETFDQQEARELLAFAQQKGIGRIAIWSLNRDRQNTVGAIGWVDITSSSILQQPYEFSQIFRTLTG